MPSTFIATASREKIDFFVTSSVRVFQTSADGLHSPVAFINDSADPADHRNTEIIFEGSPLRFAAAYDSPVRNHVVLPFVDQNHRETDLALHVFPWANKAYIGSADGFYPIKKYYDHKTFSITVYGSSPIPKEDGMLFPVLATITQTQKSENGFEYVIRVEEDIPASLLMAMFSLPFTLLNID